jgi:hypothetical protein
MDLGDVSLYKIRRFISTVASSALRLVGHVDGFRVHNTANNSPDIPHDMVGSVGCRFGVSTRVDNE